MLQVLWQLWCDRIWLLVDMNEVKKRNPSKYHIGDRVKIITKDSKTFGSIGEIKFVLYHFKDETYYYFIESNGKKFKRRYYEGDLEIVDCTVK